MLHTHCEVKTSIYFDSSIAIASQKVKIFYCCLSQIHFLVPVFQYIPCQVTLLLKRPLSSAHLRKKNLPALSDLQGFQVLASAKLWPHCPNLLTSPESICLVKFLRYISFFLGLGSFLLLFPIMELFSFSLPITDV